MTWTEEQFNNCPRCPGPLLGRIVGPCAEHQLRCDRCGWSGNTDKLRRIRTAHCRAIFAQPEVQRMVAKFPPTKFVGYETLECDAEIVGMVIKAKGEPEP